MRTHRHPNGITLLEVLVAVAMVVILTATTMPLLSGALQRSQSGGAADALAGAIRDARMRAIATGWQYQVVAYDPAGTVPNAYRIQGMDPLNGGAWPAAGSASTPPSSGTAQMNEAYMLLSREFGAAKVQVPGGGTFTATFNSSGQLANACAPLSCQVQVTTPSGTSTLTVSQAGAIQIVKP